MNEKVKGVILVPDYPSDDKVDNEEPTQSEVIKPFEDDFANFTVLRKSSKAESEKVRARPLIKIMITPI